MITELKRTPITFDGKDGWEILLEDDCELDENVCGSCIYRDWNDWSGCGTTCVDVHGCGYRQRSFFIFIAE